MPITNLTLILGGDVPLDLFAESMQRYRRLVDALTREVSGTDDVSWVVDEVAGSGAIATIRGESEHVDAVARVAKAYTAVGQALERREVIPYSPSVADAARDLMSVLNGKITSIRFEAGDDAATITTGASERSQAYLDAFGSVEGRIESLHHRHRLSFTLYDSLTDLAVYCSLRPGQVEIVRDAWGRRAVVEGWVKREPTSGQPIEIDPVENITILPDVVAGSYLKARAIAPARPGAEAPAVVMRRLRDA